MHVVSALGGNTLRKRGEPLSGSHNRPDTHDFPARGSSATSTLCPIMASSIGRRHPGPVMGAS